MVIDANIGINTRLVYIRSRLLVSWRVFSLALCVPLPAPPTPDHFTRPLASMYGPASVCLFRLARVDVSAQMSTRAQ